MELSKDLQQLVERVKSLKDSITTEEATKTSLVMPFFSFLGYDVFNPLEFMPEYTADVGTKKGEKVDYAILQNGEPVILIEAKAINQKLGKHSSQLYRYYSVSKAKFAILTNGIQYRFYTDLVEANKMDLTPFMQIDLLNLKNSQVEDLMKFHKSAFNISSILDSASILRFKTEFKEQLAHQIEEPSDEFVRLFLADTYQGLKTQSVIAKFRPILKQALEEYIADTMNEKIKNALAPNAVVPPPPSLDPTVSNEKVSTLSELEKTIFERILHIVSPFVDEADIEYKITENYIAVLYKGNVRKWICRYIVNGENITLIFPDENKQDIRCNAANCFEVNNYAPYIISVLHRFVDFDVPFSLKDVKVYTIDTVRRIPKRRKKAAVTA